MNTTEPTKTIKNGKRAIKVNVPKIKVPVLTSEQLGTFKFENIDVLLFTL